MKLYRMLAGLFACSHKRLTFPQRPRGAEVGQDTVNCLECGQRFRYHWPEMKVGQPLRNAAHDSTIAKTVYEISRPHRVD